MISTVAYHVVIPFLTVTKKGQLFFLFFYIDYLEKIINSILKAIESESVAMRNPFALSFEDIRFRALNIRRNICRMNCRAKGGHTGADMSETDILASLYFNLLRYEINPIRWQDRFILSKGHGVGGWYCCLVEAGLIPEAELETYLKDDSRLAGHPIRQKLPELVTVSTGALGHGLPIGVGLALAEKKQKRDGRVFVLTGDGEMDEGSNWEAALSGAQFQLDNLYLIIDKNRLQLGDFTKNIINLDPLDEKWRSFGWEVAVTNGNDPKLLIETIESLFEMKGKPKVILANTIKGRGVSFMENKPAWHHKYPSPEELEQALKELDHV
ncbi:MAG: transketolase [Methylobacteriaceae bacterium]|jgi:transketolase|nr:transketolase [Methylobacteriaceae bacterium]